jgi:hypothetical protein
MADQKALHAEQQRRLSVTKNFVAPVKKLSVAEEVGNKLRRMEDKSPKAFLDICLKEFDGAVMRQVDKMRETFDEALDDLRDRSNDMERNLSRLMRWKQETCDKRVAQALAQRDMERKVGAPRREPFQSRREPFQSRREPFQS